jgi:hypothetical protein
MSTWQPCSTSHELQQCVFTAPTTKTAPFQPCPPRPRIYSDGEADVFIGRRSSKRKAAGNRRLCSKEGTRDQIACCDLRTLTIVASQLQFAQSEGARERERGGLGRGGEGRRGGAGGEGRERGGGRGGEGSGRRKQGAPWVHESSEPGLGADFTLMRGVGRERFV